MSDWQLKTPVAFIIFKRPDTTEKVFEAIRQAKPRKLFVIADGARVDRPGEAERCAAARAIIDRVDWDCEVLKNYSQINLGCGKRLPSGLDWVFDQVEDAIILEDDCVLILHFFCFVRSYLLDIERMTKLPKFLVRMFSLGVNEQNTVTTFPVITTTGVGQPGDEPGTILTLT